MRPRSRLVAVHEHESFRQGGDVGTIPNIHPCISRSLVGHEAGGGQQPQQIGVVVTRQHLDGFHSQAFDRLESTRPDGCKRNAGAGDDDRIAAPCSTPVGQDDARDGPLVVEPEELFDRVRGSRRAPPPLQIGGFPQSRLRVDETSAP